MKCWGARALLASIGCPLLVARNSDLEKVFGV